MSRNLVVCCDGTNNEVAGDATNVLRLYRMLVRDEQQIAFYDGGVGTIPNADRITGWGRGISLGFDSAMGLSIRHHFLNAYRFIVRHYQPGDKIFLVGFSRGAYTARAVAGAIQMFGVLRPELEDLSELLWATYSGENPKSVAKFQGGAVFRKAFAVKNSSSGIVAGETGVKVHCVGVWDTVSAFGTVWDMRSLPFTEHNPSIQHVRHAMAIDEHRSMFAAKPFIPKDRQQHTSFKQVWFAGVHSDIGGGYPELSESRPPVQEAALSKVSLEWMLRELIALNLKIDPVQREHLMNDLPKHPPADPLGLRHESLEKQWHLLELVPQRRYSAASEGSAWHCPNLWRRRTIPVERDQQGVVIGPVVHQSVIDRMNSGTDWTQCGKQTRPYDPKNLPSERRIET